MSTISHNNASRPLSMGNPWGAVAPRAHKGNEEFKLVPDSVQLSPKQPTPAASPRERGAEPPMASLEALGQSTALMAAGGVSGAAPMMVLLLGSDDSSKENQAKKLAENLGLVHLNMGDLIKAEVASGSDLGRALESSLEDGQRSPAVLLYELVADRVRQDDCKEQGFVLDAYPEDLKDHKAEDLLRELDGLRLIQLADGDNCPGCIPLLEAAQKQGAYYEVDDEDNEQDTADVLEALVDNFQSTPVRMMPVE